MPNIAVKSFVASLMAVCLAGPTNALETDPLWAAICSAALRPEPDVQLATLAPAAPLPPLALCAAAPAGFHVLPSVGGPGSASVTLDVGFDRATARLCYRNRTVPEAPVIRVGVGRRLTVNLRNTLRNADAEHVNNCAIDTYIDGGPCGHKLQFRAQPGADDGFYPIMANMPHKADGSTNLHVHGLLVSPQPCHDEVLRSVLYAANWGGAVGELLPCQSAPDQLSYTYDLPADHPAGLFWYHAHRHGAAEAETMMGLAGPIVVEDEVDAQRAALGVGDLVLMVRDRPAPGGEESGPPPTIAHHRRALAAAARAPASAAGVASAAAPKAAADPRIDRAHEVTCGPNDPETGGPEATQLLLNGAPAPENADGSFPPDESLLSTTMQPGQRQVWRILNASADTYLVPRLVLRQGERLTAPPLEVLARDGSRLTDAQGRQRIGRFDVAADPLLLPPAGRLEIVVHAPPAGATLYLETAPMRTGCAGDADPARRLLRVTSAGAGVDPGAADDSDLLGATRRPAFVDRPASVQRTFAFTEFARGFTVSKTNWVNGAPQDGQFDPDATDFFLTQTRASDGQGRPVSIIPFTDHNLRPQVTVHLHGQDSVTEQWTIENNTLEAHALHIHQVHFHDVTVADGNPDHQPVLDTIHVPPADNIDGVPGNPGRRVILVTFTRRQIGEFVYHCHILEHEDNGMMGKIAVVAD